MLERKKNEVDWEFNQDMTFDTNIGNNDKVFHKKFGKGIVLTLDNETAEVEFVKYGIRKVYLKFLQLNH